MSYRAMVIPSADDTELVVSMIIPSTGAVGPVVFVDASGESRESVGWDMLLSVPRAIKVVEVEDRTLLPYFQARVDQMNAIDPDFVG